MMQAEVQRRRSIVDASSEFVQLSNVSRGGSSRRTSASPAIVAENAASHFRARSKEKIGGSNATATEFNEYAVEAPSGFHKLGGGGGGYRCSSGLSKRCSIDDVNVASTGGANVSVDSRRTALSTGISTAGSSVATAEHRSKREKSAGGKVDKSRGAASSGLGDQDPGAKQGGKSGVRISKERDAASRSASQTNSARGRGGAGVDSRGQWHDGSEGGGDLSSRGRLHRGENEVSTAAETTTAESRRRKQQQQQLLQVKQVQHMQKQLEVQQKQLARSARAMLSDGATEGGEGGLQTGRKSASGSKQSKRGTSKGEQHEKPVSRAARDSPARPIHTNTEDHDFHRSASKKETGSSASGRKSRSTSEKSWTSASASVQFAPENQVKTIPANKKSSARTATLDKQVVESAATPRLAGVSAHKERAGKTDKKDVSHGGGAGGGGSISPRRPRGHIMDASMSTVGGSSKGGSGTAPWFRQQQRNVHERHHRHSRRDEQMLRLQQSVERLYSGMQWRVPSRSRSRNRIGYQPGMAHNNDPLQPYEPLLNEKEKLRKMAKQQWNGDLSPHEVRERMLKYDYLLGVRKRLAKFRADQHRAGIKRMTRSFSEDNRNRRRRDQSDSADPFENNNEKNSKLRKRQRSNSETRFNRKRTRIQESPDHEPQSETGPRELRPPAIMNPRDYYFINLDTYSGQPEVVKRRSMSRSREYDSEFSYDTMSVSARSRHDMLTEMTNAERLEEKRRKKKEKMRKNASSLSPTTSKSHVRFESKPAEEEIVVPKKKVKPKVANEKPAPPVSKSGSVTQLYDEERMKKINKMLKKSKQFLESSSNSIMASETSQSTGVNSRSISINNLSNFKHK